MCIPASLVVEATSWVPGDQTSATEAFGEEPRGWLPPHHPGRTMSHAHPQMQRTGHTGQQGEGEGVRCGTRTIGFYPSHDKEIKEMKGIEERQTAHLGPLQRARAHTHTHRETERCQGTMSFRRQRGADDRQKISPPVTEKWDGGRENACLAQVGLFRSGTLTVDDSFRARERGGKVRTHSMLEQQKS